jgi:hypothetical protein
MHPSREIAGGIGGANRTCGRPDLIGVTYRVMPFEGEFAGPHLGEPHLAGHGGGGEPGLEGPDRTAVDRGEEGEEPAHHGEELSSHRSLVGDLPRRLHRAPEASELAFGEPVLGKLAVGLADAWPRERRSGGGQAAMRLPGWMPPEGSRRATGGLVQRCVGRRSPLPRWCPTAAASRRRAPREGPRRGAATRSWRRCRRGPVPADWARGARGAARLRPGGSPGCRAGTGRGRRCCSCRPSRCCWHRWSGRLRHSSRARPSGRTRSSPRDAIGPAGAGPAAGISRW